LQVSFLPDSLGRNIRRSVCVSRAMRLVQFLTFIGIAAQTAHAQSISVGAGDSARVVVAPGARLAVPVRVDLSSAAPLTLASLQADVRWNSARLTFDSVRVVASTGFSQTANTASAGTGLVTFNAFSTSSLSASGALTTLYFTAGTTSGATRLSLTPTEGGAEDGTNVLARLIPRGLDVCVASQAKWGDVNDDGTVSIIDAQQIARFSVGLSVANIDAVRGRGDVNADANVSIIDAQQIARFSVALSASARTNTAIAQLPPVQTLAIVTPAAAVRVGQGAALSATALDSTGASVAGCAPVVWSSSNATVATVRNDGVLTAIGQGSTTITVASGGRSATALITVSPLSVAALAVAPATTSVLVGQTATLVATARDSTGVILTGRVVSWSSANAAIASVSSSGVVSAISAGSTTITATSEGVTATAAVTVGRVPVASVSITPGSGLLFAGQSVTLTATALDSVGSPLTGRTAVWASSVPSIATVSAAGVVSAVAPGQATVSVVIEGKVAVATITVTTVPVRSISVTPASGTVESGGSLALTATPRDSAGAPLSGRLVQWSSSDPSVALVSSGGVVVGVSLGTVSITATTEGYSGSAQLAVVQPVATLAYQLAPDPSMSAATAFSVQVTAKNSAGTAVPDGTARIRLSLIPGPTGSDTLIGTVEQPVLGGGASFTGLKINRASTGYRLVATVVGTTKSVQSSAFDVTVGLASKLGISTQPPVWTAGVPVGLTPVRVEVQDAGGNLVTFASPTIALALASAPSGATLGGTLTVTATAGVATFTTPVLTRADTTYQLRAAATNLTAATGARFTVQSAEPVRLGVVRLPATTVAGAVMSPSPQVEVQDSFGNRVLYATDSVFIRLTGPGSTLSGTVRRAALLGLVDLPDLAVTLAGGGFQLVAESPTVSATTSNAFTIAPAAASTLRFTTEAPATSTAGVTLAPAVVVTAFDRFNNVASTTSGTVAIAADSTTPVTLLGTLSRTLVSGVASFTDLSIRTAGAGYRLRASLPGLTAVRGNPVTVRPAAPNKLTIAQQPLANALGGTPWTPALTVRVEDTYSNLVDTATTSVTASLTGGTAGAALVGTKVVNAVGGIATFGGLAIDKVGAGYVLPVTSTAGNLGITGENSTAVAVAVGPAAALRFVAQPGATAQGQPLVNTPSVEIVDAGGNRVTTATDRVSLALVGSLKSGALAGTASVNAIAGLARFEAVGVTTNEPALRVAASAVGRTGVTSQPFDVFGQLTAVEIITRPRAAFSGDILPTQPVLRLRDSEGTTVRDSTINISAAFVGPASGSLGGTVAVRAVNGIATFTNLTVAGTGGVPYKLEFSGAAGIVVRDSVTLHRLDIVTQPVANINGTVLPTTPSVRILDVDGNVVTTQSKVIVVAVDSGPTGSLTGNSVTTTNGAAAFTSLALTGILGNRYVLSFSAPGLSAVKAISTQILEQTFLYAPQAHEWTVPAGVGAVSVNVRGGRHAFYSGQHGRPGQVSGIVSVSPGLLVLVAPASDPSGGIGGKNPLLGNGGSGAVNFGGAGAASVVRFGSADVVAGGSGAFSSCGGNGYGWPSGYSATNLSTTSDGGNSPISACPTGGSGGGGVLGGLGGNGEGGFSGQNGNGGFANLTMEYLTEGSAAAPPGSILIRIR
jgi:uncharacterized protein YjdB